LAYYYQLGKLLAHPKLFTKIHGFVNVVWIIMLVLNL
jgi:hypothetical protein